MSDIDEVLDVGGFHVKQWISSEQSDVKENPREVTIGVESPVEKVSGTVWLPKEDMFTFKIKLELAKENLPLGDPGTFIPLKLTKRLILCKLAVVFDSMGAGAAVFVKLKIAMQELWQIGVGWGDEVPPEIKRKWMKLFEEMIALNNAKFKRCLTPPNVCGDPSLIVFSDASRQALVHVLMSNGNLRMEGSVCDLQQQSLGSLP